MGGEGAMDGSFRFSRTLILAALALGMAWPAAAHRSISGEPRGSASRGRVFAARNCAACHAISGLGASPNPEAPPFRKVAKRYKTVRLDWELESITEVGHYRMPPRAMSAADIVDVVAYIRSLDPPRERRKGRADR
ncbi:MAG: cytochrome c [Burkholderiales bacterium]|nr:cytochrome c [Burkholderiales bacterium]